MRYSKETAMAKRIFIAFVLLGFAFSLFFGFTGVQIFHDGMKGGGACVAALLRGGFCPALEDIAASLAFHIGGLKLLSTATIDGLFGILLLALVSFSLASFTGAILFVSFVEQRSLRVPCAVEQDFLQWFSRKLHSPPF